MNLAEPNLHCRSEAQTRFCVWAPSPSHRSILRWASTVRTFAQFGWLCKGSLARYVSVCDYVKHPAFDGKDESWPFCKKKMESYLARLDLTELLDETTKIPKDSETGSA